MPLKELFKVKQKDRNDLITHVIESSSPTVDFYFLIILSTLIVALGLIANNIILVIGGMLVAPLLYPVISLSLGLIINNTKVILRSLKIFGLALLFSLVISFLLGYFIKIDFFAIEIIKMMRPSWISFVAALVAGIAASYTWCKKNLDAALPAVAITVTLIPPLTALGLSLAQFDWHLSINIAYFFILNLFGIVIASLSVFLLMSFYKAEKTIVKEIKEEEKELKK